MKKLEARQDVVERALSETIEEVHLHKLAMRRALRGLVKQKDVDDLVQLALKRKSPPPTET